MTALPPIEHSITIRASKERVWETLTEPSLVEQWLGCLGFKPQLGTLFYMQPDPQKRATGDIEGATHCEVEALEAPDRLRFSWFMPGTPKTNVEILLTENADHSTTVSLVHSGWDQFNPDDVRGIRDMLDGGWSSFVLPALKRVSETSAQ